MSADILVLCSGSSGESKAFYFELKIIGLVRVLELCFLQVSVISLKRGVFFCGVG